MTTALDLLTSALKSAATCIDGDAVFGAGSVPLLTVTFFPAFTSAEAAALASSNCFTFTASVSSVPANTPLMALPPALISSWPMLTVEL